MMARMDAAAYFALGDGADEVRVALLADTHGDLDARIAAEVADCDCAVHAGDVGAAAVMQALRPRSGLVVAVRGNNDTPDKWPVRDRAVLQALPGQVALALPGGLLLAVHGHQLPAANRHAALRQRYPEARLLVYGHSHRRVVDRSAMPWVVNPGAAGRTRTYGGPSLVIVEAARRGWRIEERGYAQA